MITEQECRKCGEIKSIEKFQKKKGNRTGWSRTCARCLNRVNINRINDKRKKARELIKQTLDEMTCICRKCKKLGKVGFRHDFPTDYDCCYVCARYMKRNGSYNLPEEKAIRERVGQERKRIKEEKRKEAIAKFVAEREANKIPWAKTKNAQIGSSLRSRVLQYIKGISESENIRKLIGCSREEFRRHLEEQFSEGMSWETYGKHGWHFDHILPCASFDLTKEEDKQKCFHFSNYQPLWALDNIGKGARII